MARPTKYRYMKLVIQIAKAKKSIFPPTECNTSWLRLCWELRKITWLLRGCVDCFVSEYSLQFWFQEVPLIFRLQLKTNFINVFFRKQIIKQMVVKLSYRRKKCSLESPHEFKCHQVVFSQFKSQIKLSLSVITVAFSVDKAYVTRYRKQNITNVTR